MEANGSLKPFLLANTGYLWYHLIVWHGLDGLPAADRGRQPRQICTLLNSSPSTTSVTEPCCHKMSEWNRRKGRSELGFLPARSRLLLIYIESFVAPTSLCIFNLSELIWALRQQVVEKHSFNLQHMFRTTCLLPVLAQCRVIGIRCKCCLAGWALRYDED